MHTIGKLAAQAGVSPDTLHYYEKERLIRPAARTAAGYRLYDAETLRRLRFIKRAQQCGFTLSDIKALLDLQHADNACREDVRNLAIEKRLYIEHKLKTLQTMSCALDALIQRCAGGEADTGDCPILSALESSLHEMLLILSGLYLLNVYFFIIPALEA